MKQSSCPGPKTHVLDEARRQKGSRGWWEAQRKIDKCHRRIRGLRHNAQHQMTSTVTRKFSDLVIEDLNVAGLMRGNTPRAQADAGMGDIKRQLIYKGRWRHTEVILAPMWFPSSKTCSACGTVNADLKRERMWICPNCGARHDRNLNAAINLRNLIMPEGRGRSGRGQDAVVQQTPWDSWHGEPGVVKECRPSVNVDGALTTERRWRATRVEAGITGT